MKECFLITSYCNTEEKINILNNLIDRLNLKNIDICLYANYPINKSIQEKCKYYIFDGFNPILTWENDKKGLSYYNIIKIGDIDYEFRIMDSDYGYTPLNQIKKGCYFLNNLGYNILHIVNYDLVFDDNLFDQNQKILESKDGVFYQKRNLIKPEWFNEIFWDQTQIYNIFFSIKIEFAMDIINQISKEDFINSSLISEQYFFRKIENLNYKFELLQVELDDYIKYNNLPFEFFPSFFAGLFDGFLTFIFFDSNQSKTIKITIDKELFEFEYKNNFSFKTNIEHEKLIKLINNKLFSIEIDGVKISNKIIDYIKYNLIYKRK